MIIVLARFLRYILVDSRTASGRDGRVGGQIFLRLKGRKRLKVLLQMDVMKLVKNLDISMVYGYLFRARGHSLSLRAKTS